MCSWKGWNEHINTMNNKWLDKESNTGPLQLQSGALPLSYPGKHPRYNYSPNYYIPSYLNSLRPERHKFTLPGLTITYIHFLTRKATAPPVVGNEEYEHINTIKIHGQTRNHTQEPCNSTTELPYSPNHCTALTVFCIEISWDKNMVAQDRELLWPLTVCWFNGTVKIPLRQINWGCKSI